MTDGRFAPDQMSASGWLLSEWEVVFDFEDRQIVANQANGNWLAPDHGLTLRDLLTATSRIVSRGWFRRRRTV